MALRRNFEALQAFGDSFSTLQSFALREVMSSGVVVSRSDIIYENWPRCVMMIRDEIDGIKQTGPKRCCAPGIDYSIAAL